MSVYFEYGSLLPCFHTYVQLTMLRYLNKTICVIFNFYAMKISLQTKSPFHQSSEFYCHLWNKLTKRSFASLYYIIFCSRYNNGIKIEENSPDLSEYYILTYNVEICPNNGMLEYRYEVAPN